MRLAWTIGLAVVIGFRNSASLMANEPEGGTPSGEGAGAVHLLVILYILCNNKLVIYYIQQQPSCVCSVMCRSNGAGGVMSKTASENHIFL